jgi:predicted nucleic acid-binding protein
LKWVVDTCVVIDVLEGDPRFGISSAQLLDNRAAEGLVLCPVSYVELAPAFLGDLRRQNEFLANIGIEFSVPWEWHDTQTAHKAWQRHVTRRRTQQSLKRPVANILIGSFASGRKGLLTRNPGDFRPVFPDLQIVAPGS